MYSRRSSNPANQISGGIFLLTLALAFGLSALTGGLLFLPTLFFGLALSSLLRGIMSGNPRAAYGAFHGFVWMIILAVFFLTHWWEVFLVGAGLSAILGTLIAPITALLVGLGINRCANVPQSDVNYQPAQPYQAPELPPYEPGQYQEGYQPSQQPDSYQEGGQVYTSEQAGQPAYHQPQPYEQPTADYPQELPPQQ